jgi:hypothetical protein
VLSSSGKDHTLQELIISRANSSNCIEIFLCWPLALCVNQMREMLPFARHTPFLGGNASQSGRLTLLPLVVLLLKAYELEIILADHILRRLTMQHHHIECLIASTFVIAATASTSNSVI